MKTVLNFMTRRRKSSAKIPQAGGDWSVRTKDGVTPNLSEKVAWELFLHHRVDGADLLRGNVVMASRNDS